MGYCRTCQIVLRNETWKPYCRACYQRAFPFCDYCKNPIHEEQERINNYHKFPCYSLETQKCCECFANINREQGDGIYCAKCYEVKNAPPLKLYVKYKDNEFSLHSRDDKVVDALKVFSDGIYSAIQSSLNQRMIQEAPDAEEPPRRGYLGRTMSYVDHSVRGVTGFVTRNVDSSVRGVTGYVTRKLLLRD
ncbi:uncharacterized protein LOC114977445 [Acropora millepora]|uniref:uncharacterized protein LOC114977445 n=1 Tax=Acropora millepora TaxID=45264 RepID=UPI001CF31292|nr:uncharacterized protein LOC114977445 [Acropora millepora]